MPVRTRRPWLFATVVAATVALLAACQPGRPVANPAEPTGPRPSSTASERATAAARPGSAPRSAEQWLQQGQPIDARLQRVQDGDSLVIVVDQNQRLTVRLSGIDAPERSQPFANAARKHLQTLLEGHRLTVLPAKVDRYGRLVAQVIISPSAAPPEDAGLRQLEAGFAWFYERYQADLPAADRRRYREAAQQALQDRRGLWSQPAAEPPWDFRSRR